MPEDSFQFERHGYFVADREDTKPGRPVNLQWPNFDRVVSLDSHDSSSQD